MTLLVGQNGTGWTLAAQSIFQTTGNAAYFFAGYTAVASGSMTAAHTTIQTTGTGNAIIYVYTGVVTTSTSLLATSAQFPITATGDVSAAITGNIVAGQTYTLVMQCGTNSCQPASNSGSNNFKLNQNTAAHFTYNAAPTSIPASDASVGHEFVIWIDGTTGPSTALMGQICM